MMNILKSIGLTLLCATLFAATAITAAAQGSRKDDVVYGPTGRPMAGASVAICTEPATTTTAPCSPLASLYSNSALTESLANPLSTDGLGNYFFYAAPGKYTIQIYGPGITTRVLPDVILPSDPSAPTFTSVTTTSGISAFSLSLAGNLAVSGSTAVAGTLTVGGVPITGGGGGNLAANNAWSGNNSFKGPIPYWDVTAWGASGSNATATGSSISLSTPTTITLGSAQDFANGEGVMVPGAGPASSLSTPTGVAAVAQGTAGTTSHTYKVIACDTARGCSAAASVTLTNANATLSPTNYVQGAITPVTNAAFYAIYKDGAAWDTFSAELSPSYAIASISRASNVVTAVVNQNCPECNLAIPGSSVTVSGVTDTSYDGTFTVTSATYITPTVYDLVWSQTGSNTSSSGGAVAQPVPFYDRGAGAVSTWPLNVPIVAPSAATDQWYLGQITAGGGTTSLTVTPAATTAVSGATTYHDDTAAINAANAACATQRTGANAAGGTVYLPPASTQYNAFGVLVFPKVGPFTFSCDFRLTGFLQVANTVVLKQNSWSIHGLGGWGPQQFASAPTAAISVLDGGVMPTLLVLSGSPVVENLQLYGPANGVGLEIYGQSEVHLNNVQTVATPSAYGPSVKLLDACCWTFINGGTFEGNGIDDAVWIAGSGAVTPSNQVRISDTTVSGGGIKVFEETGSQGPDVNTLIFDFVTSEGQSSSLYDFDARNVSIEKVSIFDGGMYDATGTPPLLNILGSQGPGSVYDVTLNNTSQQGAYIGSSVMSLDGPAPCILGLSILNSHPAATIASGTACAESETFDGTNGLVLTGAPANFGAASSLKVPPHVLQGAANGDVAGASACASGAKTITFANAYSSTPVILIFDETTHGGASITAKSASSFAVACTGASDAFDYLVIGNPN
jgi:hypothetical protein